MGFGVEWDNALVVEQAVLPPEPKAPEGLV